MKKSEFDIQGMSCSSCQAHVQKAVEKLSGIKDVNVNLLSNSMIVKYDEKVLDDNKIIDAVVQAGFGATIKETEIQKNEYKQDDIIKSMKKRLIISVAFLIPLVYIAMHNMLYEIFKIPVPQVIKKIFDGTENALLFGFIQFILLVPIVYVNRKYFIVGLKKLFKKSPNMDSLIAIGSGSAIIYGIYAISMIAYGVKSNNLELVESFRKDIYFESAGTILTLITVRKIFRNKS